MEDVGCKAVQMEHMQRSYTEIRGWGRYAKICVEPTPCGENMGLG